MEKVIIWGNPNSKDQIKSRPRESCDTSLNMEMGELNRVIIDQHLEGSKELEEKLNEKQKQITNLNIEFDTFGIDNRKGISIQYDFIPDSHTGNAVPLYNLLDSKYGTIDQSGNLKIERIHTNTIPAKTVIDVIDTLTIF